MDSIPTFLDAAADQAHSIAHFHSYVMWLLTLILIFVCWGLILILKFAVAERDLVNEKEVIVAERYSFKFFCRYALVLLYSLAAPFSPVTSIIFVAYATSTVNAHGIVAQTIYDAYYTLLLTFRARKLFQDYGLNNCYYTDLGVKINVFPTLPALTVVANQYRTPTETHFWFKQLGRVSSPQLRESLVMFRTSKHDVPYLFPFYRVDFHMPGPFVGAEDYLNYYSLLMRSRLAIKWVTWDATFLQKKSTFHWKYSSIKPNRTLGLSPNRRRFVLKTFSIFSNTYNNLVEFYSVETRTFFYLYFQGVRHRKWLEWVWTCVPAVILSLIVYPSLRVLYRYDRPLITKPYMSIKIFAHQWFWTYEYSDFVTNFIEFIASITISSFALLKELLEFALFRLLEVDRRSIYPIGLCLRLLVSSADVLHSWTVATFGVKIDAIPGRLNQVWVIADRVGTFYGQCSELCGVNHAFMPISIEAAKCVPFLAAIGVAFGLMYRLVDRAQRRLYILKQQITDNVQSRFYANWEKVKTFPSLIKFVTTQFFKPNLNFMFGVADTFTNGSTVFASYSPTPVMNLDLSKLNIGAGLEGGLNVWPFLRPASFHNSIQPSEYSANAYWRIQETSACINTLDPAALLVYNKAHPEVQGNDRFPYCGPLESVCSTPCASYGPGWAVLVDAVGDSVGSKN